MPKLKLTPTTEGEWEKAILESIPSVKDFWDVRKPSKLDNLIVGLLGKLPLISPALIRFYADGARIGAEQALRICRKEIRQRLEKLKEKR